MKRAGQVALITGAGRGIGRAIAVALARQGIKCAITARRPEGLRVTAALMAESGVEAHCFTADLLDPTAPDVIVRDALHHLGRLDILINNAGQIIDKPFADTTMTEFDRLMTINLRAPVALAKAALPYLEASGHGVIINIASAAGKRFYTGQSAYCASKHGLLGWSKVLAAELRPRHIRVHSICPGGVATDMTMGRRPEWTPDKMMAPEDIAQAVLYLLSLSPRAEVDELMIRRTAADPIWG